jgi:hypothetical protein
MAEPDRKPVTLEDLLVSSLAQTDALAKLLIEKGLITREEFMCPKPADQSVLRMCIAHHRRRNSPVAIPSVHGTWLDGGCPMLGHLSGAGQSGGWLSS